MVGNGVIYGPNIHEQLKHGLSSRFGIKNVVGGMVTIGEVVKLSPSNGGKKLVRR